MAKQPFPTLKGLEEDAAMELEHIRALVTSYCRVWTLRALWGPLTAKCGLQGTPPLYSKFDEECELYIWGYPLVQLIQGTPLARVHG
eukprot:5444197-Amphidinium_carterae.3